MKPLCKKGARQALEADCAALTICHSVKCVCMGNTCQNICLILTWLVLYTSTTRARDRRGTLLLRSRRTFCCVFSLDCGSLTRLLCAIIALESLDLHFKTHCSVSDPFLIYSQANLNDVHSNSSRASPSNPKKDFRTFFVPNAK